MVNYCDSLITIAVAVVVAVVVSLLYHYLLPFLTVSSSFSFHSRWGLGLGTL